MAEKSRIYLILCYVVAVVYILVYFGCLFFEIHLPEKTAESYLIIALAIGGIIAVVLLLVDLIWHNNDYTLCFLIYHLIIVILMIFFLIIFGAFVVVCIRVFKFSPSEFGVDSVHIIVAAIMTVPIVLMLVSVILYEQNRDD